MGLGLADQAVARDPQGPRGRLGAPDSFAPGQLHRVDAAIGARDVNPASGRVDRKWIEDHLPADGSAVLVDETFAWTTIGLWGPRARDVLASVTSTDVSNEGFPFSTGKGLTIGSVPAIAGRISYVGDLGWEIYATMYVGRTLWDTLWEAGRPFGIVPVGIGTY